MAITSTVCINPPMIADVLNDHRGRVVALVGDIGPNGGYAVLYEDEIDLHTGGYIDHRDEAGAPFVGADVAADPTTPFPVSTAWLDTSGYESVMFHVAFEGGVGPTVTIQPILYDEDLDAHVYLTSIAALGPNTLNTLTVHGNPLFLRIGAVGGNPTRIRVRVAGAVRSVGM